MRINVYVLSVLVLLLSLNTFPNVVARFFPGGSAIPPASLPNSTSGAWDSFRQFVGCRAGQQQSGLAKLKNYFHHFGYIPESASNFTDDFDEELQSALRTYQQNFNLDVTGELDEKTLKQILRPRCGNADVINGSSSMNSGKAPSAFGHTVAHYAFFPGMPRWPEGRRDLSYAFLPGNQLGDDVKSVFARAFQRWSAVIPMNFTETDAYTTADIRIGFFRGDHGDGEPFDGVLGTLAHSFSPPSGRFHLDLDENWVVSGDVTNSQLASAVDLESVAVHEIGHLLGLGHSSVEEAIMYPTISSRTRKVDLANDDILGVQQLYGSNPNYDSSSTPNTQQNETSGTPSVDPRWGLSVILAVGFLFLLL